MAEVERSKNPELLDHAEIYAKDFNVSVDEAIRRLQREFELSEELHRIAELEADRLAGIWIEHEPEFVGKVALVGDEPPTRSAELASGKHTDVRIVTGAEFTKAELVDALERGAGVARTMDGFAGIGVSDRENGLVVRLERSARAAVGPVMADAMIESQLEASAGVPVRVSDAPPSSENKNIFGGKNMSQTDPCTSGFTVNIAAPNSGSGIIGAGHCNSVRQQAVTMTNMIGVNSSNMDVRLLRIPSQHNAQPKFWQGTKNRRVHGVWTGTQGSPLCHYGRNSGKSCGVIAMTPYEPPASHCPNSPGCTAFAVLVEGPSLRACNGDSGGPWFRAFSATNRRAVGIHEGSSGFTDCVTPDQVADYVPINSVLSFLSNFQNWGAVTLNT